MKCQPHGFRTCATEKYKASSGDGKPPLRPSAIYPFANPRALNRCRGLPSRGSTPPELLRVVGVIAQAKAGLVH